jgi:peptide/nickel transport system substrate-binding protein
LDTRAKFESTALEARLTSNPTQLERDALTRRGFLAGLICTGMGVSAVQSVHHEVKAAQPRRGGTFRIGIGHASVGDTLDPALITNAFQASVGYGAMRNALTVIGVDGQLEGDLAESFDATRDARRWTFKLRSGVEFHNGKSLSPQDVIASINHHRGTGSTSGVKSLLSVIDTIKGDGPNQVVFELKQGTADFAFFLADWHIPIGPSYAGQVDWAGIGTGPFVLDHFEPGVSAHLHRYNNYHHSGKPYFDSVVAYAIPDVAARTSALTSGSVDYIDRAEPKTLDRLRRVEDVEILVVKGTSHFTAPMNSSIAPFNDPNVRLAVKYAIDREEIVRKILGGYGLAGNDNPIAEGLPFHIRPEPVHSYDPEKARFLLRKAGMSDLRLSLTTADSAFVGAVDTAVLMRNSAARAGIDIEVVRATGDAYWTQVWMKKPWCMSYWNGRSTCDWLFSQVYGSKSPWNETSWQNEKFDQLMIAARPELDPKRRSELYAEMQRLIHEDSGQVVLMFNHFLDAHSKRLRHGEKIATNLDHDGYRIFERWWFA